MLACREKYHNFNKPNSRYVECKPVVCERFVFWYSQTLLKIHECKCLRLSNAPIVWDVNVDGASDVSDYVFMGVSDAFGVMGASDALGFVGALEASDQCVPRMLWDSWGALEAS